MRRLFKALIFLFIFVLIIGGCSYGVYKFKVSQTGSLNVAIIGIDSRQDVEGARSDTLMLAHVNQNHKTINLISIPRDSFVYIPKVNREDKITHAFAYGGREETLATLNHLFETNVEYYIEVDFEKMISLVDSIGGIELTPTATFCEMDQNDNADQYCFEEGVSQHMDGAAALSYARHRKSDSDLFRAQRQQEVVKAMISKVKGQGLIEMYNFYNEVKKISDTNLDLWQLIGYMDMAFQEFDLKQEVADGYSDTVYNDYYGQYLSYFFINEDWLKEKIKLFQE